MAELSILQFLAFVLSSEEFDGPSGLSLQKDRSPDSVLAIIAGIEHLAGGLALGEVEGGG